MLAAQALGQRRAVRQGVPAEPARCTWRQPLLLYHQCILFHAGPGDAVAACQTCQAFIQYAAEVHLFAVGLQAVAQFQQERLQGLVLGALADVAEGADRPLQFAVTEDRCDPVFDGQAAAIDAEEQLVFHMPRLTGDRRMLDRTLLHRIGAAIGATVVDHMVQVPAQYLFTAGEAENLEKGVVAQGNGAVAVDGIEAFVGRIQQQAGKGLTLQSLHFRTPAAVDVLGDTDPAQQLSVGVVGRRRVGLEPAQVAVDIAQRQLQLEGQLPAQCGLPLLGDALAITGRHSGQPAFAGGARLAEPGELAPVAVAEGEATRGIALPDDLRAEVDQGAVALLGFARRRLLLTGFGQVAQDLDEALRLAVVQQWREDAAGPEA